MYDEIVKALRNCKDTMCGDCAIEDECSNVYAGMRLAADAIEKLMAEVDRKDKALQAWVTTWEKRRENAIRHICDHCDTPIEVRLKEGACEDCPIITLIREVFENGNE